MESMSSLMKSSQEWAVDTRVKPAIQTTPITAQHAWPMTLPLNSCFSVTQSQMQTKLPRSKKQPAHHMSIDKPARIHVLMVLQAMAQKIHENVADVLKPA